MKQETVGTMSPKFVFIKISWKWVIWETLNDCSGDLKNASTSTIENNDKLFDIFIFNV